MAKGASRRRNAFRLTKEIRKLARERIGAVPPGRTILPATASSRKKPKHPKREKNGWIEG